MAEQQIKIGEKVRIELPPVRQRRQVKIEPARLAEKYDGRVGVVILIDRRILGHEYPVFGVRVEDEEEPQGYGELGGLRTQDLVPVKG